MREVRVIFGTEYDKDGAPIPPDRYEFRLAKLKARLVQKYGGYTLYVGAGGWKGPDGAVVEEHSLTVSVFTDDTVAPFSLGWYVKALFDQSSVLVVEKGEGRFI